MSRVEVRLAPLLRSYTAGVASVPAVGVTLADVLRDLDRRFPGIAFRLVDEQDRVRRHVRLFVNEADERDLDRSLRDGDRVFIVGALSGG